MSSFIGVAVSDAAGISCEALRTQATTALKIATLEEAGTVTCFEDEMLKGVRARQAFVADLRKHFLCDS